MWEPKKVHETIRGDSEKGTVNIKLTHLETGIVVSDTGKMKDKASLLKKLHNKLKKEVEAKEKEPRKKGSSAADLLPDE